MSALWFDEAEATGMAAATASHPILHGIPYGKVSDRVVPPKVYLLSAKLGFRDLRLLLRRPWGGDVRPNIKQPRLDGRQFGMHGVLSTPEPMASRRSVVMRMHA